MIHILMIEPEWGQLLLRNMNNFANANDILKGIIPYTSNIFVLSYPIYLLSIYTYGIFKRKIEYKYLTLYTCTSVLIGTGINLIIQGLVDKIRPEHFLSKETIIFQHILNKPFPSDHATISSVMAISTILWGIKHKQKTIVIIGIIFCIFTIIMSLSRISAGVHRPTDVIFGSIIGIIIGIIISLVLIHNKIFIALKIHIFDWIIKLESSFTGKISFPK